MHCASLLVHLQLPYGCQGLNIMHAAQAHGFLLNTVSRLDQEFGAMVHGIQRAKPFTLACLGDILRLTFIGQHGVKMMNYLLREIVPGQQIRIGRHRCTVTQVALDEVYAPGVSTLADLGSPSHHQRIRMDFLTETAVTRHRSQGQRFMVLFPEPDLIFGRLADYWQKYTDQIIPGWYLDSLNDNALVVTRHQLETSYYTREQHHQNGFIGFVVYECLEKQEEFVQLTNTLARFAPYVGIGFQTARGMGAVSVDFLD